MSLLEQLRFGLEMNARLCQKGRMKSSDENTLRLSEEPVSTDTPQAQAPRASSLPVEMRQAPGTSSAPHRRQPMGTRTPPTPSRREFLKISGAAVLLASGAQPLASAAESVSESASRADGVTSKNPHGLAARFGKFLRVTDVTDGLDAVGRADLTLLEPGIRPLWMGMRFWGPG